MQKPFTLSLEQILKNTPMEFDLFTSLFLMGVRFALVLGVMRFILSLRRNAWNVFSSHE